MRALPLLATFAFASCAWTPVVHQFPSGLRVVRGDQVLVAQACASAVDERGRLLVKNDKGEWVAAERAIGCYAPADDTIYLRNTDEGARYILHELAHREGVKDPSAMGYDW